MIKITDLHHTYQTGGHVVHAVDGLSLTITKGAFVAIIGPSGAGKSTLLHLIGGLDRPTSGTIEVDGRILSALSDRQLAHYRNHYVGFVFQNYHLQKHLKAWENVSLPLKIRGAKAKERKERARKLLVDVGLAHRWDHLPKELSGGECQRAAIARAVVTEPKVLLADEPTGNLDSATGREILRLLMALNSERELTMVMVTHDQKVAELADCCIHIRDGKNTQEGEMDAV